MTDTMKEVFEKHEIRKTKKQKARFREFVEKAASENGWRVNVEKVGGAHNVIVGSPSTAKVLYTAHYDTPAATPFPNLITPKCLPIYILYQLLICLALYTVPMIMILWLPDLILKNGGSSVWAIILLIGGYALLILECYLLVSGPANKHNSNDNTSGVTVLLELMRSMPSEKREDVAFIFFDLEEKGTLGSQGYRKKHKKEVRSTPVINFDCVGDGATILFALNKKARHLEEKLNAAFVSTESITVDVATKGVFYPSDQKNFDVGVGVAALNTSKHGILYTSRIHTKRDVICNEDNIAYLVDGSIKLAEII